MWAKVRCSEREGLLTAVSAGKTVLCVYNSKCTLAINGLWPVDKSISVFSFPIVVGILSSNFNSCAHLQCVEH